MDQRVLLCHVLCVLGIVVASHHKTLDQLWTSFKHHYGKMYKTASQEKYRKQIFCENYEKVSKHNERYDRGLTSFKLGLNKFSDLTRREYLDRLKGSRKHRHKKFPTTTTPHVDRNAKTLPEKNWSELPQNLRSLNGLLTKGFQKPKTSRLNVTTTAPQMINSIPKAVDWRDKGSVTYVKDQGDCGSCWSFSTAGAVEGQLFKKTKQLISLSEQNLIDCCAGDGIQGCNGGWMDYAFQCIINQGGINAEKEYPYEAKNATCRFNKTTASAKITGFIDLPEGDEDKLMEAVARCGPVSAAIDASHDDFQLYTSGVYDNPDCSCDVKFLDHAILIVGYGQMNGRDVWIVKNCWSDTWGEEGYIYMSRNKNNQCGIASKAGYPVMG